MQRVQPTARVPVRASAHAAGYDLAAAAAAVVPARGRALISTGLVIAVPEGCYGRIAARSGLASRCGLDVGAGVIDADYRGVVSVLLFNHSDEDRPVYCGDRIAQLVLEKIATPDVVETDTLVHADGSTDTARGAAGFGSTGV